ncbi:MAG TPA: FkbM family methyltransferase [Candidatus Paceibacterota bacterium]|nr:FkbM family methyltransferase [Candidatus Paceibacterota bacterium]
MLKRTFVLVVGWMLARVNRSDKLRDLITWPIATRVLGRRYRSVVTLVNGLKLEVGMQDILTRFLLFYGPFVPYPWEPQTTKLLEQRMKEKRCSLIAGSHIGYVALMAARAGEGKVVAFEPVDYLFEESQKNFSLNPGLSLVLERKALSNRTGEAEIYVEDIRSSLVPYTATHKKHDRRQRTKTVSIDDYARESGLNVDLIFLDVEGFELPVLRGCSEVVFKQSILPELIFEVSPKVLAAAATREEDIYEFLRQYGYRVYIIEDNYKSVAINKTLPDKVNLIPLDDPKAAGFRQGPYFNVYATNEPYE